MDEWKLRADKFVIAALYPCFINKIPQNVRKGYFKVRIDMLQRFRYYSTESNGHLSEYVPWYRKNEKELLN